MESVDVDKFSAINIKTEIEDVVETKVKIEYNNDQLEPLDNFNFPINCDHPLIKTEDFLEEQECGWACYGVGDMKRHIDSVHFNIPHSIVWKHKKVKKAEEKNRETMAVTLTNLKNIPNNS